MSSLTPSKRAVNRELDMISSKKGKLLGIVLGTCSIIMLRKGCLSSALKKSNVFVRILAMTHTVLSTNSYARLTAT